MDENDFELRHAPGHLIRRAQQVHTAVFADQVGDPDLTSPQFAVLAALHDSPGIDQVTLSQHLAIDRSTIANMVRRMEDRGLLTRIRDTQDTRRNVVSLTAKGRKTYRKALPGVVQVGQILLEPLSADERERFLASLAKIVAANDEWFAERIAGVAGMRP